MWRVLRGEGMKSLRAWVCSARRPGFVFVVLLLAAALAPASVAAHAGHEHGNVIANADGDNVRLRSGPSYDDGEITRFPEGTGVDIVDGPYTADDGSIWYQVDIDGQAGYMDSAYLVAVELPADEESVDASAGVTSGTAVTNDSVFLRAGPSTADAVVRPLEAGEQVTLTGEVRDGWNAVSASDGDGWVFAEYLDVGSDSETPASSPDESGETGTRVTIDSVHLRSGPGTDFDSITYLEPGVPLELTGRQEFGFARVDSSFGPGWVAAEYIGEAAPVVPVTPDASAPAPDPAAETSGMRYTIDSVNLREGAGTEFDSLASLDAGVELELTGDEAFGFVEVTSSFGNGWVSAEYLGNAAPAIPTEPETTPQPDVTEEPAPEPEPALEAVARFTTANVNLRTASNQASTVVTVVPSSTEVEFTGLTADGFSEVRTTIGSGWLASEFLAETRPEGSAGPDPAPVGSGSLITWPVSGDEWVVSQGYNGSSHQNQSGSWQYYYSLDLKRADGSTAGQPVYSAVNGTVRWIDEATGGMSIYMGDGLAYAYFHTRIDPSISEGETITQGQYMGTIAPAGEAASGSSAHLHITVWETADEGNWSRQAIPFTGNVAISGVEFPPTGSGNDYLGYTFNP